MPVAEYVPILEENLHAVLWTGKESDLEGMPGIDSVPHWIENNELYIHYMGEADRVARPNEHYVVRGVTGYFFVVKKDLFEQSYLPIDLLKDAYPEILEDALVSLRESCQERTGEINAAYAWLKHIKAMRPAPTPLWTPTHVTNVLGKPYSPTHTVDYDRAVNLCNRIIGHYEFYLESARWAFAKLKVEGDGTATQYILSIDGDSHWFVIPEDKKAEWYAWCEAIMKYWDEMPDDQEEPVQPEWAVAVGGAPSRVKFSNYEIK